MLARVRRHTPGRLLSNEISDEIVRYVESTGRIPVDMVPPTLSERNTWMYNQAWKIIGFISKFEDEYVEIDVGPEFGGMVPILEATGELHMYVVGEPGPNGLENVRIVKMYLQTGARNG